MSLPTVTSPTPHTHLLTWREDSDLQPRLSVLLQSIVRLLGPARCHLRTHRQLWIRADHLSIGAPPDDTLTLGHFLSLAEHCHLLLLTHPLLGLHRAHCLHLDQRTLLLLDPTLLWPTPHRGYTRVPLRFWFDPSGLWFPSHAITSIHTIPADVPVAHIYDSLARLLQHILQSQQLDCLPETRVFYWLQQLQSLSTTQSSTFRPLSLLA